MMILQKKLPASQRLVYVLCLCMAREHTRMTGMCGRVHTIVVVVIVVVVMVVAVVVVAVVVVVVIVVVVVVVAAAAAAVVVHPNGRQF